MYSSYLYLLSSTSISNRNFGLRKAVALRGGLSASGS